MNNTSLDQTLQSLAPIRDLSPEAAAAALARVLLEAANRLQTPAEREQQEELERMMQHPEDKTTLMQITDQAFRTRDNRRSVEQLTHILDVQGVPRFFGWFDRALLRGFKSFGGYLPNVAAPIVKEKMREETATVILPAERELLEAHLTARRDEGLRMNVNFLGEALLGEEEAMHRLEKYLEALQRPEIEVVSVKISTLYSQISPIGREHTIQVLCDRFERLVRAAAKERFTRADGSSAHKFVYLDMEEYRDMSLTTEVFLRTLDRRGLEHATAGIALQAYIPDSFPTQRRITEWAAKRVAKGGAPVIIRIVKGANMEMERVEASIMGWPQAPYQTKPETDANYKRMLAYALEPAHLDAVRVGIASHNLFDLSLGLVLAARAQAGDRVQFEMLEGMANHQRRALFEICRNVLLYAPATPKEGFLNAIGYLIRRLDENTGEDNFLRHAFRLSPGSPEWQRLEKQFLDAFTLIPGLAETPRRTQDRRREPKPERADWARFANEPDTDFSLPHNSEWIETILRRKKAECGADAAEVPLVITGQKILAGRPVRENTDPSRPGIVVARYRQATAQDIEDAVRCAKDDPSGWRARKPEDRAEILAAVAHELRKARGRLIAAAVAEGGKTVAEADPEVSEAVDFAIFYAKTALDVHALDGLSASPLGVVVVVPPWNFPIAIPCGGVAAALAAGNTVLLKPASSTVHIAHEMCRCFWDGGVPREALQFVPCAGGQEGSRLASHEDVDAVILTGGTETGFAMLKNRHDLNLFAETGGKNATILTDLCDRELAIKQVLHSAFSHCGQKCSATSLLILEDEVYDDPAFKEMLVDAASSLHVGSAWDMHNKMGPLIRPPSGDLEKALKELEPGESWALMPQQKGDNPSLWTPGIKYGVQPGSYTHHTEFFGPVLGVMRAASLKQAIEWVNATGFGLTSGLQSLDAREHEIWLDRIRAGNLYINRPTTGAIVLRQPFGGMGKSAFGPGIKAGGPNYVIPFLRFTETPAQALRIPGDPLLASLLQAADDAGIDPAESARVSAAFASYERWMRDEFGHAHETARLVGEDNRRRYLPVQMMTVRVQPGDENFDVLARIGAALLAGAQLTVSHPPGLELTALTAAKTVLGSPAIPVRFVEESENDLCDSIREGRVERIRFSGPDRVPAEVYAAASTTLVYLARTPVLAHGRVELLWYMREQSISHAYHRYGNLGVRTGEEREPVL